MKEENFPEAVVLLAANWTTHTGVSWIEVSHKKHVASWKGCTEGRAGGRVRDRRGSRNKY